MRVAAWSTPRARPEADGRPLPRLLSLPYPLRNLVRRWRGMLGMMLGVGIALGIVMTLAGIGRAILEVYTLDYRLSGADLYVITQGGKLIPYLASDRPGNVKNARHVLAQVRGLPGVHAAVGVMSWSLEREPPGPRHREEVTELVAAMGVDGDPTLVPNMLLLSQGRWLRRTNEVVLGAKLSRDKGLGVGDSLRLAGRDFTVVGIGRLRGVGFSGDALAYLDYRALRQRAEFGDVVNVIAIDTAQPALARERIPELGALTVLDPPELIRQAEEALAAQRITYGILDALALTIGALFVNNMLAHSVAERRQEFATLRAIGVRARTILVIVASEALLISVVSGALGMALSLTLGACLNGLLAPRYALEFLYAADGLLFFQTFALALGFGLVSGLLPARQATRVDPVEVLREA